MRVFGRIESIEELQQPAIAARQGTPVRIVDVAEVQIGAELKL